MRETPPIILGLSPGTRSMGIAILKDNKLIDWRVKAFAGKWSKEKLERIVRAIQAIVDKNNVAVIGIKIQGQSRSSLGLNQVVVALLGLVERNDIPVHLFTIKEIEHYHCGKRKKNKLELRNYILETYPELFREYEKENRTKRGYYMKIFEAVAVAGCAAQM